MKGQNPFMRWEEEPEGMIGRKDEERAFAALMDAVSSGRNAALMVTGGPGTGKTMLLRHFRQEADRAGLLALYARAEKGESAAELAGRLHREMLLATGRESRAEVDSLGKLAGAVERGAGKQAGVRFGAHTAPGQQGAIILMDDIDALRKAEEAVSGVMAIAGGKPGQLGIGFVMSSTRDLGGKDVPLLRLGPFDAHDAEEFVTKALGKGPPRMGDECLNSLIADSSGNPRIFRNSCGYIYGVLKENEKVISKGHYLAALPGIMSMLGREWFGRLYNETPSAEREILAALAKSDDGMHVSDIAKKLGKKMGPTTALVGRLLDSGQIVRLERGKYRIFARLYARYVAQRK